MGSLKKTKLALWKTLKMSFFFTESDDDTSLRSSLFANRIFRPLKFYHSNLDRILSFDHRRIYSPHLYTIIYRRFCLWLSLKDRKRLNWGWWSERAKLHDPERFQRLKKWERSLPGGPVTSWTIGVRLFLIVGCQNFEDETTKHPLAPLAPPPKKTFANDKLSKKLINRKIIIMYKIVWNEYVKTNWLNWENFKMAQRKKSHSQ